jgi:hypothetical protein
MPIGRSKSFFDKDFDAQSIQDIANVQAQKWIEAMRKELSEKKHKSANGKLYDRVGKGTLQKSLIPIVSVSPKYVSVEIETKNVKYGKVVDKGRKPNSTPPPITSMLDFIKNRGIKPNVKNPKDEDYKFLALKLSKSIGKKGIPATNFVSNSITKKSIEDFKKDLLKGIKKGLL